MFWLLEVALRFLQTRVHRVFKRGRNGPVDVYRMFFEKSIPYRLLTFVLPSARLSTFIHRSDFDVCFVDFFLPATDLSTFVLLTFLTSDRVDICFN